MEISPRGDSGSRASDGAAADGNCAMEGAEIANGSRANDGAAVDGNCAMEGAEMALKKAQILQIAV